VSASIGILWRADRGTAVGANPLFDPLAKAFAELGVAAEPVLYADARPQPPRFAPARGLGAGRFG